MLSLRTSQWLAGALASGALVACGNDGATPDAAPIYDFDFSCLGNTIPSTIPAMLTISGATLDVYTQTGALTLGPLADAQITACASVMPICDSTTNAGVAYSGADGSFGFNPPPMTGGMPLDVYMYVSKVGSRTTYLWPNSPLYADNPALTVPVMQDAFVSSLSALGIQQDPAKALVALALVDCMGQPIVDSNNVEITLSQDGKAIGNLLLISAQLFNENFSGSYFILNVPPGPIDIAVTYKGMPMRGHAITTYPGTTSQTKIAPGFSPT